MITQFANKKLERIQLLLGVVLFCVFISYSLNHAFPIYSTYIIVFIIIQAVAVLILMRQMMQNKTSVKPYFAWKANKYHSLQFNYSVKIIGFSLLGALTAVHFYIDYKYKGNIMPLIYDYGIGGVIGLALKFAVLERKWNLGLADKGVIFGSKFDTKLIIWKDIAKYDVDKSNNEIIITCKSNQPIKTIKLQVGKQIKNSMLIIEQALSK
jgi:hypothetical protein